MLAYTQSKGGVIYEQSSVDVERMASNTQKNQETMLCLDKAKRWRYHQRRSSQAF